MNPKYKSMIFVLFLSTAALSFLQAQEPSPRRLSLEDAVRLAMKQNPDLISARLEVKRSDARVLEAWGNAMPAVDVSGQYVHMINKQVAFFPDYFLFASPLASPFSVFILDTRSTLSIFFFSFSAFRQRDTAIRMFPDPMDTLRVHPDALESYCPESSDYVMVQGGAGHGAVSRDVIREIRERDFARRFSPTTFFEGGN
jgi:hypothetical protein